MTFDAIHLLKIEFWLRCSFESPPKLQANMKADVVPFLSFYRAFLGASRCLGFVSIVAGTHPHADDPSILSASLTPDLCPLSSFFLGILWYPM